MDGLDYGNAGKVKDKLRKAGSSLREFDDAYAAKVAEGAHPRSDDVRIPNHVRTVRHSNGEGSRIRDVGRERSGEVRATGRRRHAGRQGSVRPDADDDGSTIGGTISPE